MFRGQIRQIKPEELGRAFELETDGYPVDEAASFDSLQYRLENARELFLCYVEDEIVIAYICGTRYPGPVFKHESMRKHIPSADCVCIHSVCVDSQRRRQGIGRYLMQAYVDHIRKTTSGVKKIMLLTKQRLVHFYEQSGFVLVGRSNVEFANVWQLQINKRDSKFNSMFCAPPVNLTGNYGVYGVKIFGSRWKLLFEELKSVYCSA